MSHSDSSYPLGPVFEQPDGVPHVSEEPTVPLGDFSSTAPYGKAAPDDLTVPLGEVASPPAHGTTATDDLTLPLVDLYPTAESWNAGAPQLRNDDYWRADASPDVFPSGGTTPAAYRPPAQTLQEPAPQPHQASPHTQQPGLYGQQPVPYMHPAGPHSYQFGPYAMAPQEHPQATAVLVLGVISFVFPILSFIAWFMGGNAKREIERGAPYAYTGNLKTGHVIGKVVGIITIAGVAAYILFIVVYVVFLLNLIGR